MDSFAEVSAYSQEKLTDERTGHDFEHAKRVLAWVEKIIQEDGFVVEPMNTLQQAFLFARDDHYKKIAYNPTLSSEEQTKALLNSYGYYLLSEDLTSNFLLKYVTDISEEQQKIIRDFRHEVLQLSAQKEIHPEQFASSQTQPNKQMIKKSNS